ncbi:MAG: hypothetical protein AB7E42_10290 [Anaerotignaceae bacterium]
MNISINISDEDLKTNRGLVERLAVFLNGVISEQPQNNTQIQQSAPIQPPTAQPQQMPTNNPFINSTIQQSQQLPVQQSVPIQQTAPMQQSAPITAPAAYTLEQLALAAAPLMDAGKMEALTSVLQSFGVVSLQELPVDRYGAFATAIRGLGANI